MGVVLAPGKGCAVIIVTAPDVTKCTRCATFDFLSSRGAKKSLNDRRLRGVDTIGDAAVRLQFRRSTGGEIIVTNLNRRNLLAGTVAAALSPLMRSPADAGTTVSGAQAPGFQRYKVGSFEGIPIKDGASVGASSESDKASKLAYENLPEALKTLRTRPLFVMQLSVRKILTLGDTPAGRRRIGVAYGGAFEGERLSGEVLDGGNDWQLFRADGALTLDVRLILKTNDGDLIAMSFRGLRHGPSDILRRIDQGDVVDLASYYSRINPLFETSSAKYDWLNRIIGVGIGHRLADGPIYSVFEVL
jgi:hypothetical protein